MFLLVAACVAFAARPAEIVYYTVSGGDMSPYRSITVKILPDGAGAVDSTRYDSKTEHYSFALNPEERREVMSAARSTRVFDRSFDEATAPKTAYFLRVSLDGRTREARFFPSTPADPLVDILSRLINQPRVLEEFDKPEKDCDVYIVTTAASPHLVGWKVYQPRVLRKPLEEFILKVTNPSKTSYAFEALAWLINPEEWTAFARTAIDAASDERRYEMIRQLSIHPFTSDIPQTHVEPLKSTLMNYVQSDYPRLDALSPSERRAIETAAHFVGRDAIEKALSREGD